MQYVKTGMLM